MQKKQLDFRKNQTKVPASRNISFSIPRKTFHQHTFRTPQSFHSDHTHTRRLFSSSSPNIPTEIGHYALQFEFNRCRAQLIRLRAHKLCTTYRRLSGTCGAYTVYLCCVASRLFSCNFVQIVQLSFHQHQPTYKPTPTQKPGGCIVRVPNIHIIMCESPCFAEQTPPTSHQLLLASLLPSSSSSTSSSSSRCPRRQPSQSPRYRRR